MEPFAHQANSFDRGAKEVGCWWLSEKLEASP